MKYLKNWNQYNSQDSVNEEFLGDIITKAKNILSKLSLVGKVSLSKVKEIYDYIISLGELSKEELIDSVNKHFGYNYDESQLLYLTNKVEGIATNETLNVDRINKDRKVLFTLIAIVISIVFASKIAQNQSRENVVFTVKSIEPKTLSSGSTMCTVTTDKGTYETTNKDISSEIEVGKTYNASIIGWEDNLLMPKSISKVEEIDK